MTSCGWSSLFELELVNKLKPALSRRAFLRLLGGLALVPPASWLYATELELRWLQVERLRLSLPGLPRAFHGLTIAQISDLHVGPYIGAQEVRAAVEAVMALQADVIVITGDFVSSLAHAEAKIIETALAPLSAPLGGYGIMGNHDWWNDRKVVRRAVEGAGLTMLQNERVAFTRAGESLYLAGLDDYWQGKADLAKTLSGLTADAPVILLVHEPDYADLAARDPRVLLQLSGHSHGGQVRLPFIGPLELPRYAHRYPLGLQKAGDLWVYTNRGIGVTGLPVRFNCRPEVTLLTLNAG